MDRRRTQVHGGPERRGHRGMGFASGAGEGEQGRARPGDGSPRRDWRRRGGAMGPEITTVAASRRRRHNRLGGEEK
jgi:hypothetical protein